MAINSDDQHALMIAGAKSYPQALAALNEFRRLTVDRCTAAMQNILPDLAAAIGLSLPVRDLFPYTRPDSLSSSEIDGDFGMLGAAIQEANEVWWLGCYLHWCNGKLRVVTSI